MTRGNGVSVHRADCPNISKMELDRSVSVSWEKNLQNTYIVELEINCADKSGVLTELLAIPSSMKLNIHSVHADFNKGDDTSTVKIGIDVNNAEQVDRLMSKMRLLREVYTVTRPISTST